MEEKKKDVITQMVDAIAGEERTDLSPEEKAKQADVRKRLSGRAMEYLMFMDDDEE